MISDVLDIRWVNNLAKNDMMAIEAIVSEVCAASCEGLKSFALFDGGAHKGYHTKRMGALAGCEAVYAVEADPAMAEELSKTLAKAVSPKTRNRIFGGSGAQLHLINKALQNDPERDSITWKSSTSHIGRSSIAANAGEGETIWVAAEAMKYRDDMIVPATTIDQILANEGRPVPFLKLDLEGADILSLMGARKTLQNKRPIAAFENSIHAPRVHGFTLKDFAAYLTNLDYVAIDFVGRRMSADKWFGFFEAWLVPRERIDSFTQSLTAALERQADHLEARKNKSATAPIVRLTMNEAVTPLSDDADIQAHIAERLWSHPERLDQAVEIDLEQKELNVFENFEVRTQQVLQTLGSEGLRFKRAEPSLDEYRPDRQWMLDTGRLAWLLWLGARRSGYSADEAHEQLIWIDEAKDYRNYTRGVLYHLRREGVRFAGDN